MSHVYSTEPTTCGRVTLYSSLGKIELELWAKEAPKTVRHFLQLALEGRYDGSEFHRIVPGFLVQTGKLSSPRQMDVRSLPIEAHSRLRFRHRGILGMAADAHDEDPSHSQFFITLAPAEHLQGKHTVFGRVVGDSIFTVLRIGEVEVDEACTPVYPPMIQTISVLENPYDDILLRPFRSTDEARAAKPLQERQVVRDRKLLSFDEEEEGEVEAKTGKMVSCHDAVEDPRLSKIAAVIGSDAQGNQGGTRLTTEPSVDTQGFPDFPASKHHLPVSRDEGATRNGTERRLESVSVESNGKVQAEREKEFARLRDEIISRERESRAARDSNVPRTAESRLEALRRKYKPSRQQAEKEGREESTLKRLREFSEKLRGGTKDAPRSISDLRGDLHFPCDVKADVDELTLIDPLDGMRNGRAPTKPRRSDI